MPTFKVETCTVDDGVAMAVNNMSAFWTNINWHLIWTRNNKDLDYVIANSKLRQGSNLLDDRPRRRHQKAVDESGKLVGYIRWTLPEGYTQASWPEAIVPDVSEEVAKRIQDEKASSTWDYNHDLDVLDDDVAVIKKRHLDKNPNYIILDYLAVHPDNWGKGIATLLVEHGLTETDKLGLDVFVLACAAGKGVYTRAGFVELDKLVQDDSMFGGTGCHTFYFMARKAGGKKWTEA